MFPSLPSVIVIVPVVEFPVFNVMSWFPLDLSTPAPLPDPIATSPSITTVPSEALVIVSSLLSISPEGPVISILVFISAVFAVTVVKAPDDAELAPMTVPSIVPPSISTLLISTSPVPLGERVIFPLAPSVIVMLPVVEFPV